MKKNIEAETEFPDKFWFRRQFIIGPHTYSPNKYWHNFELKHQLFLSIHKDLSFFSKQKDELKITLIGLAVDCTSPYKSDNEIVTTLLNHFNDIHSVIETAKPLAGRWVLICQNKDDTFIFTDPCGLRQVYFSTQKSLWCASQPTLINQVEELPITSDESIIKFINSTNYKKKESAWIGNKTLYEHCLHLMPNHYLDLDGGNQVRFFPRKFLSRVDGTDSLASDVAKYLKNIMEGLEQKYNVKIALSAGFDSRLLLAASKDISHKIGYSTGKMGKFKNYHADIYVPKNLAKRFNLNHDLSKTDKKIPPPWFSEQLAKNVSIARISPMLSKIKSIYSKLVYTKPNCISLSGNVIEIVRIEEKKLKYERSADMSNNSDNLELLITYAGYDNNYVKNEIDSWNNSIDTSLIREATMIDMFYWEQRMGNWGALYPAEVDIASESLSPFNCRLLLEICLKVPREQRMAPDYPFFKNVIRKNWPEVLLEPINPGPRGFGLLKKALRDGLPPRLVHYLRKVTP